MRRNVCAGVRVIEGDDLYRHGLADGQHGGDNGVFSRHRHHLSNRLCYLSCREGDHGIFESVDERPPSEHRLDLPFADERQFLKTLISHCRRPAVAYYDVSDPTKPTQLARVILGPPYTFTESEAVYDEKAFKILDELGLIVIPFSHASFDFDETPIGPPPPPIDGPGILPGGGPLQGAAASRTKCVNAVQLVEFSDRGLEQRGWFDARSRVQRVGIISDRIFAISQAGLQTIDISDRDNPVEAGEAAFFDGEELARFGCSDFFIDEVPIPIPIDGILDLTVAELLAQIIRSSDMCATVSVVPMISLVAGMTFMRRGKRRRRK